LVEAINGGEYLEEIKWKLIRVYGKREGRERERERETLGERS